MWLLYLKTSSVLIKMVQILKFCKTHLGIPIMAPPIFRSFFLRFQPSDADQFTHLLSCIIIGSKLHFLNMASSIFDVHYYTVGIPDNILLTAMLYRRLKTIRS